MKLITKIYTISRGLKNLSEYGRMELDSWKNWSKKELGRQFAINIWNPNKDKWKIIDDHLELINEGSEKARKDVPTKLNIEYGENDSKFDIYGANLPETSTIFFWVHGGGWQLGSKDGSSFFCPNLVRLGVKCIVVGYDLAPTVKIHQMQTNIREALKKSMIMFPKSKFIVGGHSAGSHLTASILHTCAKELPEELCRRVRSMFLLSGIYDMRPFVDTYVNQELKMTRSDAEELSPFLEKSVNPNFKNLKIIVAVGEYESPWFKFQSAGYSKHLQALGLQSQFSLCTTDDHFSIIETLMDENSFIFSKLRELIEYSTYSVRSKL